MEWWNLNMQSCTVNLNKLFSRFAQNFWVTAPPSAINCSRNEPSSPEKSRPSIYVMNPYRRIQRILRTFKPEKLEVRSPIAKATVDGRNPAPVEGGSLPHYLQGLIHPRWLFGISSINSITHISSISKFFHEAPNPTPQSSWLRIPSPQ